MGENVPYRDPSSEPLQSGKESSEEKKKEN
jgi:hypothetical protein